MPALRDRATGLKLVGAMPVVLADPDRDHRMGVAHPRRIAEAGTAVGKTSVGKCLACHRKPPQQPWLVFTDNHVESLVSVNFFPCRRRESRPCRVLGARSPPAAACSTCPAHCHLPRQPSAEEPELLELRLLACTGQKAVPGLRTLDFRNGLDLSDRGSIARAPSRHLLRDQEDFRNTRAAFARN